jgi:hypothetical protein
LLLAAPLLLPLLVLPPPDPELLPPSSPPPGFQFGGPPSEPLHAPTTARIAEQPPTAKHFKTLERIDSLRPRCPHGLSREMRPDQENRL